MKLFEFVQREAERNRSTFHYVVNFFKNLKGPGSSIKR